MFGHVINLNFDKQGDSHKTFIGGIISIMVKILMFVYVSVKFDKLIYREGSSNAVTALLVKMDTMGEVMFNQTSMVMFYMMKKQ